MSKQVFISREVDAESPFRLMLEGRGWTVIGESLIRFSPVAFDWPVQADWIFFSSSRGFHYLLEGLPDSRIPSSFPLAVMGPGTEKSLADAGYTIGFVGNGKPEEVAQAFRKLAYGKKVLFPQATHSRRSIQHMVEGDVEVIDLLVYDNEVCTDAVIPPSDAYVLTSPLNAEAFHGATEGKETRMPVIAIGRPTAEKLHDLGYSNVHISSSPTPVAMADAVIQVFQP